MNAVGVIELAGSALDVAGVLVIVVGIAVASAVAVGALRRTGERARVYPEYRQGIGRSILLGLEFLVAGDIIRTVAVSPTLQGVGVLAVIVAIRTFLSFSLQVELDGRWPWQRRYPQRGAAVPDLR